MRVLARKSARQEPAPHCQAHELVLRQRRTAARDSARLVHETKASDTHTAAAAAATAAPGAAHGRLLRLGRERRQSLHSVGSLKPLLQRYCSSPYPQLARPRQPCLPHVLARM